MLDHSCCTRAQRAQTFLLPLSGLHLTDFVLLWIGSLTLPLSTIAGEICAVPSKTAAAHEFGMRQLRVFCVAVCVAAMKLCVAVCVAVCVAALNDSPRAKGSCRKRIFFPEHQLKPRNRKLMGARD